MTTLQKMPNTRTNQPKPAAARSSNLKPRSQTNENGHRTKRASSCPRCYHDNVRDPVAVETSGRAPKARVVAMSEMKTRTLAKMYEIKTTEKTRTAATTCESKTKSRPTACVASQSQQRSTQPKAHYETQSNKAFTVFAPNPKKRQDIQKKAEAELAALEDLRLSLAMNYVSISPTAVGGCLTLEEVRIKQQQEMQIKKRQKQMKKYTLEPSPMVLG
ncbi:uncharacterized protein zgc:194621 [Hoplias malabaricus]|uniref:uncharacterized protein zgc:194621 n=1 Tax=Hoplias malabaricus TaxID=27720 RepID=UPI0034617C65